MGSDEIDAVDKGILYLLQDDARNNTTEEIAQKVGVSSSTVGNRINDLEREDVITDYYIGVDYEKIGLDHHLLITGTAPFEQLDTVKDQIIEVLGVVSVRVLLTNERNVSIEIVAENRREIERTLSELNEFDIHIEQTQMMKTETNQPLDKYGKQVTDEQ